jgi:outer membrane beta-barrel protein
VSDPRKWAALLAIVSTLCVSVGTEAYAQDSADDSTAARRKDSNIIVLQRKPFLRKGRVELTPQFGLTVNDSLMEQFELSGSLVYHLNEDFWLGGSFRWYDLGELGGPTDAYDTVIVETSSAPDVVELEWYGGADFGWVPLVGKFALFNSFIVYYDASLFLGGGYMQHIQPTGDSAGAPAASVGVQQRLFLADWLALTFEVRNTSYMVETNAGDALNHTTTFSGGASIFVPSTFKYEKAR